MKYPDLASLVIKTEPKEIRTITYDNRIGTAEQHFTFEGSETVTTAESWSVTGGMEVGVEAEVTAGIPILAEGKITVSAKVSVSSTYERNNSTTSQQSFSFPLTVPVGEHIQATATLYEGDINTAYTATMRYILDSGETFQYTAKGIYSGISASEVDVSITAI